MTAAYVAYKASELLLQTASQILQALQLQHVKCMNEAASKEQVTAWNNSIGILRNVVQEVIAADASFANSMVVFEYELPRERGRRPDVLFLLNSIVVVIEFKQPPKVEQSYIDQASAYARDLHHYHEHSHNLNFKTVLLMASHKGLYDKSDEVVILSPDRLAEFLMETWAEDKEANRSIDYANWLEGDYAPLPSLVQAARLIFKHEPLPSIRRASSAGIPETLKKLHAIANNAKANKEHHLALITGVPGAGKTLVGISFVYEVFNTDEQSKEAVLLSGNGPLVEVLQYALDNRVFVQDVHGFLKRYGGNTSKLPLESIFIYDEAQRAWDSAKVNEFRGHPKSEPEDFLEIGKRKEWCLMIGLIGEGQEIHLGEEAGIAQWNDAIASTGISWKVSCPSKLSQLFNNAASIDHAEELNLTQSLRSHLAEDVQVWINELLSGNISKAASVSGKVYQQQFDIYITRDLTTAKNYLIERYRDEKEKRYGLLASSKATVLPQFGVMNDFMSTRRVKKGPWYIDERESHFSCCQFRDVMTEFGCQGLELDFPIVCWGDDFIWDGAAWQATKVTRGAKDSFQLRKNSYRVLLSRGRDGMIVYVPALGVLDKTYEVLVAAGVRVL